MISKAFATITLLIFAMIHPAMSQDMMDLVDLTTPEWSESDSSREEVMTLLENATSDSPADLKNRFLSGLDLSNLDFSNADLRWARMNNTNLMNSKMHNTRLDLAWLVNANMENVDLTGASLRSTQLRNANLKNTIFDDTRITANFKGADLTGASFRNADLSADMKNQSMGLMGTVMTSSKLIGVDFSGANMARVDAEYGKFNNAILDGVNLSGSKLAGATLTGASVKNLNLDEADLHSTRMKELQHGETIIGLGTAQNLGNALR